MNMRKEKIHKRSVNADTRDDASNRNIADVIKSVYTQRDLRGFDFDHDKDLGMPGEYPFTRGSASRSYAEKPWMIRGYSGFGEAQACNRRYKKLIEFGVDEIVIATDLPTQVGYDSDDIMAKGEVGFAGVAIDTLRDMELLFEEIPLNTIKRISMLGNSYGPIALALFIALGEKQGLKSSEFVVDLQNDVLKEYVARGTYIFPIRDALKMATDVVGYCAEHIPHWYPMTICANHLNAAGAGSTKATAFAMANAICYITELLKKNYGIDEIAPLLTMFLDERSDFFIAISNFRAATKVWAKMMKQKFNARKPESMSLKITAYSHGGETLNEPLNNIARITLAGLAYVLGGVQFLYNASYDEVLGTPSEDAAKIAIRTQQILAHELGIAKVIDPLGGSYLIESLTGQIETQIEKELDKVESFGGAIAAIEKGYYARHLTEGAIKRKSEIDSGKRISVGVNKFKTGSRQPISAFKIDSNTEKIQQQRLHRVKVRRNQKKVTETLEYVREVASRGGNLVVPILEAVRTYTSVGEICTILRETFGEYQSKEYFHPK